MSPLNITQPKSVYGLLDGYYKVMSNIPKMGQANQPLLKQKMSKLFDEILLNLAIFLIFVQSPFNGLATSRRDLNGMMRIVGVFQIGELSHLYN